MERNCLTCKWEPDWPEYKSRYGYEVTNGECKFELPDLLLPACVTSHCVIKKRHVERYSDDSGIHHNCRVWSPKPPKGEFLPKFKVGG